MTTIASLLHRVSAYLKEVKQCIKEGEEVASLTCLILEDVQEMDRLAIKEVEVEWNSRQTK